VIAWLASFAFAGVPLVHDGGDVAALTAAVAQKTGLPAAELTPVALDTLLAAPPQVLGAASLRRSAQQPSTVSALQAEIGRARAARTSGDDAAALDHLDLAVALAGCLPSIVAPAELAEAFLLRAAVAAAKGDRAAEESELRTALALDPDAVWPEGDPVLAAVRADPARASLSVLPPPLASGPWIDGHAVAATQALSPGLHLAQYTGNSGIRSGWLTIGGDARLVLAGSYRRPILEQLAQPEGRDAVAALLAAAIPDLTAAYVAHAGGLWLITAEDGALTIAELVPMPPPAPVAAPVPARKKR
jgi:hypothetical protein